MSILQSCFNPYNITMLMIILCQRVSLGAIAFSHLTSPIPGYCGWNDTSKGAFDWNRDRGGTPSSNTGPTVDHTLGKQIIAFIYHFRL